MRRGGRSGHESGVGVLDAGVVIVCLNTDHRSHSKVADLFHRCCRGDVRLFISAVNLAEALHHSRDYTRGTGLDPVLFLAGFGIEVHAPEADTARRVAELATLEDASLADRFAVATTEHMGGRLYTTDHALAAGARKLRIPTTLFEH